MYVMAMIELVLGSVHVMLMTTLPLCGRRETKKYPGDPKAYELRTAEHTKQFATAIKDISVRYKGQSVFLCDTYQAMVQAARQRMTGLPSFFEDRKSNTVIRPSQIA